jgi:hypothetical protein
VTTSTLSQQFAAEYAKGVVPAILTAIKTVKRNAKWVAAGALLVSTPHQALYLASLSHDWTAWIFAVLIPAVMDLGMLTMLTITQTAGMNRTARRRAMIVLAVLVTASATVNAIAPGPLAFRVLTAFTAATLAAVEWVASSIAPDFTAIETAETDATVTVPATAPADEARRAARRDRDRTRRAAEREAQQLAVQAAAERKANTAERRRLARLDRDLEHVFAAADAPVSPAPGEAAAYL